MRYCPVAIVGMSFRFPGDLSDETLLWHALKEKRDLICKIPSDRWATNELQHHKRANPGRSITFSAGVLSRIDEFDAEFFGISPREAAHIDPQQRLLLELAWEVMENAGIPPASLAGSNASVYVGMSSFDYSMRTMDDLSSLSAHSMTGNSNSIAANRLSYVFDLHGPSLTIDTACSSSLVALHHACESLSLNESQVALVGGVNLLLHPSPFVGFTKASMLSASGRCRPFDAAGDGYVRAEGAAVLLLKPLEKALADGDDIQAVILSSGVNADGSRKTGITIPSREGQIELMQSVLAKSQMKATDIDFIEAHGTGTPVGDPIEASAISAVYAQNRVNPLLISSVKSNLGHLEPASGMAGLVKTVLSLKNHALPPALHFTNPNPNIDFVGLNLEVPTHYQEIHKEDNKPLLAGINSFGFGGANAHVLLQEFRSKAPATPDVSEVSLAPLYLSARSEKALRALAERYALLLKDKTPSEFYDIAYASAHQRGQMEKRLILVANSATEAATTLSEYGVGQLPAGIVYEDSLPEAKGLAFVYSGNGSQWLGMGRKLLKESPRFAEIMAELDLKMKPLLGSSISNELCATESDSRFDDTAIAQPLLFAIQVALTLVLKDLGIRPTAVAGHSVGEVAAAWAAGALDLSQAIRVIVTRSKAQGTTRGTGRMAVVGLSESETKKILAELGSDSDLVIAGFNSPNNQTLSGSLADLERIQSLLEQKGVFFRLLNLDYAFHSHYMNPIKDDFIKSLSDLNPSPDVKAVFVSTVTGDILDNTALDANYWWRNVREPVRFSAGIKKLADLACRLFMEIGPHAILQRNIGDCFTGADIQCRVLPMLRKGDDGQNRLVDSAMSAHLLADKHSTFSDFDIFFPRPGQRIRLPNYPWQRERHWHPTTSEAFKSIRRRRVHPVLGWLLLDSDLSWENVLDSTILPWLADHKVGDSIVFPGAAYAEMALAAAKEWLGGEQTIIEEIDIVAPMVFDAHAKSVRFLLNPHDGSFLIRSRQRLSSDDWTLHAKGRVLEVNDKKPLATIKTVSALAQTIDHETHYRLTASLGLNYGSSFQRLAQARVHKDRLEAKITSSVTVDDKNYFIHPAVLDACFQSLADFFCASIETGKGSTFLPIKLGRIDLYRRATVDHFRAHLRYHGTRSALVDFELFDQTGLIASISGCRFRAAPQAQEKEPSLWRIVTNLRPHPLEAKSSEFPAIDQLTENLRTRLTATENQRQTWYKETLPLFEALTLSFAYEAFLALEKTEQKKTSAYERWLAHLLSQEGLFSEEKGCLVARGDLPTSEEIWQTLFQTSPSSLPQLSLLGRVGHHLPDLLTSADHRDFLNTLWDSPAVETLYDNDPAYLGSRLAIEGTLDLLANDWPKNRQLRVLEISAGSNDLAHHLLGTKLKDQLDYVIAYDDDKADSRQRASYQEFGQITVARLNTTDWTIAAKEPLPENFDIVIFYHVLHKFPDIHLILNKAQNWLTKGGLLLLAERYPDWSADFLHGLDPAWWHDSLTEDSRSTEGNSPMSSLVSPKTWRQALSDEGFERIECLTEAAAENLAEGTYLLVAQNPKENTSISLPTPETWLLLTDATASGLTDELRIRLESQKQRIMVRNKIGDEDLACIDHVVHFWGWSCAPEKASDNLSYLLECVQTLASYSEKSPRLWIVTRGGALVSDFPEKWLPDPAQAAVWGFGRVVMNEHPSLACTLIDLVCDPQAPETSSRLENEFLCPDGEHEIVLTATARYTLSMSEKLAETNSSENHEVRFHLDFNFPGKLRNILWRPEIERPLRENEIEVRTQAAGLNFRDLMYLLGLLPDEAVEKGFAGASLGLEFSGIVTRMGSGNHHLRIGDSVMGFGSSCFSSHIITRADALVAMPESLSFAEAATIPTVFFTVYYALKHLANIQAGERVLIHGGAGGVGVAAIQLARHLGAEIFVTAGSDEKRDFVRLLGADHVFDSRTLSFADDILATTNGEGVDIVLNSLSGESIRRSLSVLKPFGRFLELGKRDFFENTTVGLRPFRENISYFGIDADQLLIARPELAAKLFREIMELFKNKVLSPLPYRTFPASRIVDAFRVMQQARHIGKIVVLFNDFKPTFHTPPAIPSRFKKDSTWLVTGGLTGFGLESARWLAAQGVGNLVLLGRRGKETPGAQAAIEDLIAQNVNASAVSCDITDAKALEALILHIHETMPPLKGVLHAAMMIDDRLIAKLDASSIESVLKPKLLGAWNLHQSTQNIPIEYFVLYSSITTFIGNPGQANYVAANASLEGLAQKRSSMGLPVTCIAWGPIGDAGYLTRNKSVMESLSKRLGKPPLSSKETLAQLGKTLAQGSSSLAVANFDWGTLSRLLPSSGNGRFATLQRKLKKADTPDNELDFRLLTADKTPQEISDIVRQRIIQEVAEILGLSEERIAQSRSLHDLGFDSLMAVELALGLERSFNIQLPAMMLNGAPTLEKITTLIIDRLLGGNEDVRDTDGALTEGVAQQHGENSNPDELLQIAKEAKTLAEQGVKLIV